MAERVDAVITWVDGSDPAHGQRLTDYLSTRPNVQGRRMPPASAHPTRFQNVGEFDFCIRSIIRHASWMQRIHIVCDLQTPSIVRSLRNSGYADRFNLVDHRDIFKGFERHLPTFNSRSIISMLWRIEDLSERFVYFNDDMVLLRDVSRENFFRDGKVVLRGNWFPMSGRSWHGRMLAAIKRLDPRRTDRAGHAAAQELSARIAGYADNYFRLDHFPYPMRRSTLSAFFEQHPDLLERNVRDRLRSSSQFKAESLASHLELLRGEAIVDKELLLAQLKPSEQTAFKVKRKLSWAAENDRVAFLCVQSLDLAPPEIQGEILAWLRQREMITL